MNKKFFMTILSVLLPALATVCHAQERDSRQARSTLFTQGWTFRLGDDKGASQPQYDDSQWRRLNLPHDWAIEGDFSEDNPAYPGGGALPGGVGWYRKTFTVSKDDKGKLFYIDFDGVYMNATVYINGHALGTRPYGYISFSYNLTPYLKWGGQNVLAVRVDNADQPNSRWYSGCGIYRNVWLTRLNPVHVAQWGTYITTPQVSAAKAKVRVSTRLQNERKGKGVCAVRLQTRVLDAGGRCVAEVGSDQTLRPGATVESLQEMDLDKPHLWSVEDPYLYQVETLVKDRASGALLDTYLTPIGIRYFNFDDKTGFSLNGKPMKINGVCQHHDLGCLGAAVNTRAIERQLEILKEMGCNGIRCSHNPLTPELLDLCDRMGFIVMDEAFDMWRKKKSAYDYSRYFGEWHERDLSDFMVRDRNHPSVFMWSIGNEVLEQWTHADADTLSLAEANLILNFGQSRDKLAQAGDSLSVNSLLTRKLADHARRLHPTRPITAGCNEPDPGNHLFRSGALDIIGFNYHDAWFEGVPRNFPGKPFIITESVSALATRGFYRMDSDSMYITPQRWDVPFADTLFKCSAYDNQHVPWGTTQEGTLKLVKKYPFISGQYIWADFDYIGEPTPHSWPARSSYFGIIDLCGFPKDTYYLYQSEWRDDINVLHLFPHWNWEPGQTIDMWAYYNNADEVELYVNGKSQGKRSKQGDELKVWWRVTYQPGEVKAVSRKNGKVVAQAVVRTAGEPAAIRLTPDRSRIAADGLDLSFVTVDVVDKDGNLCPWATNDIQFDVQGAGFIAGVDNGCQTSMEHFKANHRQAYYGKCLVVVQNDGKAGDIRLTATAPGLQGGVAMLKGEKTNDIN